MTFYFLQSGVIMGGRQGGAEGALALPIFGATKTSAFSTKGHTTLQSMMNAKLSKQKF